MKGPVDLCTFLIAKRDLDQAKLAELTTAIAKAKVTGKLTLSSLGLTSVPRAAFEPPLALLVRRLDLAHNELRVLPGAVGALRNLEELFLNGNPLRALPDEIEGCLSLRVLDLRDTHISQLPPPLGRLPSIVDINLVGTRLDAAVQDLYARGGVLKLLSYLNERDARVDLEEALRATLTADVYREAADTELGKTRIALLVADVMAAFPLGADNADLRTVVRNAGRLFSAELPSASAAEVKQRLLNLQRGNVRKALAADIELKMRAVYYGRLDVTKLEGIVRDVMASLPELEDAQFLLDHATKLLPAEARDVRGRDLYASLCALRETMAADRAAALATLTRALMGVYPDREPPHVEHLTRAVAKLVAKSDDLRMLASEAGEIFPAEFNAAKPKLVVRAFKQSKSDKGIA